jgi:hypothetical protein
MQDAPASWFVTDLVGAKGPEPLTCWCEPARSCPSRYSWCPSASHLCSSWKSLSRGGEATSDWTGRPRTQLFGEKLGGRASGERSSSPSLKTTEPWTPSQGPKRNANERPTRRWIFRNREPQKEPSGKTYSSCPIQAKLRSGGKVAVRWCQIVSQLTLPNAMVVHAFVACGFEYKTSSNCSYLEPPMRRF